MKTLLHIDSSPRGVRSHSRRLTAKFVEAWLRANAGGRVIHRDLGAAPAPMVSEEWIVAAFTDPAGHSAAQRAAIAVSNELVDELLAADELVIGAPMYNFNVSASLKAWIDQVVRVGRTVEYPSYAGMAKGKKVTVISTRGEEYAPGKPWAGCDAQVPYLKQILGFVGIDDIAVVCAEGLAGPDDARRMSLERAAAEVERLAVG